MVRQAYTACVIEPAATLSVLDAPPKQALVWASRVGFRAVALSAAQPGFRPRDLDRSSRRGLLADLRRLELRCDAIDLFIPSEHFADPSYVDRAIAAVAGGLELAADIGARTLFLRLPVIESLETENDKRTAREAVQAICDLQASNTVRLAETTADRDDDVIGVGLDTAAWLALGRDPCAAVASLGASLAGVRVSDLDAQGVRGPVGPGSRLDLLALRIGLETSGFSGPLVVDARGWPAPADGLESMLAQWRALPGLGV